MPFKRENKIEKVKPGSTRKTPTVGREHTT